MTALAHPHAEAVLRLHREAPVCLGYINPAARFLPDGNLDYTLFTTETPYVQASLPRLRRGMVDVATVSFAVNDPELFPGAALPDRLLAHLRSFQRAIAACRGDCGIAVTAADLDDLPRQGRMALLLHLTGVPLAGSLDLLRTWYEQGVRAIHPPFDTGADARPRAWQTGEPLSPFGRRVVEEMARLGMVIDLAHASDAMAADVLAITTGPVVVSHTMSATVCPNRRNLSDRLALAIAARGGVIGIHFAGHLIDAAYDAQVAASGFRDALRLWEADLRARFPDPCAYQAARYDYDRWQQSHPYRLQQSLPPPPLARIVDHIDHFVKLVGIDHVGIGTDYDLGTIPAAVDQADKLPNLTAALLDRGYSADAIHRLWGGNFLRVYRHLLPA